ncbi:MAG: O-antigen ligase family protein [Acidobacteria bacterium]|nr:O-antigen ligase family protein [Acidobacteriota bacterium]
MLPPHLRLNRVVLAVILLGNAVAFAGVDPPTRIVTAALVVVLAAKLNQLPNIPRTHRQAAVVLAALLTVQLVPLPLLIRRLIEPGLAGVLRPGWTPLSVAPWATLQSAAALAVAAILALTAARIAATRSGLPMLLSMVAATGTVVALLGLATEHGLPGKVLLIRPNTVGGGPYGPFLNDNHFALAVELTLPAALALLAAAARHLPLHGEARRRGTVMLLAAAVATIIEAAALLRCGSRGGALFLALGFLLTLPLWTRRRRQTQWRWLVLALIIVAGTSVFAWNRLPILQDRFNELFVLKGVEGNTRWDLWSGTVRLWLRSPVVGTGLGTYRYAIGLTKPPTGAMTLEQAHNDWLEWLSGGGLVVGAAVLLLLLGLVRALRPRRLGNLRFEYRYPLAATAVALTAVALHELVGFGLQNPLNRYLLAVWIGLVWGLERRPATAETTEDVEDEEVPLQLPAADQGPPEAADVG